MKQLHPNLYVIAGPNGAGKTTFAQKFLPQYAKCEEFVNADMIAKGLSPFSTKAPALEAGRLMIKRVRELASQRMNFGFETTLSGKTYLSLFRKLRSSGYYIQLSYLWLPDINLAIKRISDRVRQGGHYVPDEDVYRRFGRGLKNLFHNYKPLLDRWAILDNSGEEPHLIASGTPKETTISNVELFNQIQESVKL